MERRIIECVPNFSEGRDPVVIAQIAAAIKKVLGVVLLDIDPGKDANRTVITFVGDPESVVEAAFQAIKRAAAVIDMRRQQGAHPRIGATDVCPLIPVSGVSMEEVIACAHQLAKRVGEELNIPVYLYENAAFLPERKNLAAIRAGEYEGLEHRMENILWKPDFGKAEFNPRAGATVIGAREFLVAYNVNLNTSSVKLANAIAYDVREKGRIKKENGKIITGENGKPVWTPGLLKAVKAIGWYMDEYGFAQVSMNLVNLNITPLHIAFETCCKCAEKRGVKVTGSELIGLIPLQALLDTGRYALQIQRQLAEVNDAALIQAAIRFLGLDSIRPFDPRKKVLEYRMQALLL